LSSSSAKSNAFFTFFPTGVYKIDATAKNQKLMNAGFAARRRFFQVENTAFSYRR
jgi:hypothetical protein